MQEQDTLIQGLRDKIRVLISLYEKAQEEKKVLAAEKAQLVARIIEQEGSYQELEKKYDVLKMAKSLSSIEGGTYDAKIKLNRIVREIDKCISLLNK